MILYTPFIAIHCMHVHACTHACTRTYPHVHAHTSTPGFIGQIFDHGPGLLCHATVTLQQGEGRENHLVQHRDETTIQRVLRGRIGGEEGRGRGKIGGEEGQGRGRIGGEEGRGRGRIGGEEG